MLVLVVSVTAPRHDPSRAYVFQQTGSTRTPVVGQVDSSGPQITLGFLTLVLLGRINPILEVLGYRV